MERNGLVSPGKCENPFHKDIEMSKIRERVLSSDCQLKSCGHSQRQPSEILDTSNGSTTWISIGYSEQIERSSKLRELPPALVLLR